MVSLVACGLMNQASAIRAARFTAGSLFAAIQIGGRGLLHRSDVHVYIGEPAARPLIGYAVLRPKALDEGQVLFKPLDTFAFRDAEGVELNVAVAQADAEDEVAPGDDVERCHRLRRVDGIVQVEQQDAETDRHLAGFCSEPRQEWHHLQLLVVAFVEVVLA